MPDWWREIRQGVRGLMASPGFTAVAILSLALAIGVNTTVLGVARAVLLEPLPVGDPDGLRLIYWDSEKGARGIRQINSTSIRDPRTARTLVSNFTFPAYEALQSAVTEEVFAFTFLREATLVVEGQPLAGAGMLVSGNYFAGMRVPIAAGRPLTGDDDREGAAPAVILSYALWQRAFGGDASAVGRSIKINGQAFTIVGIAGRGYFGVSNGGFFPPADVTLPLHAQPIVSPQFSRTESLFTSQATFWLHLLARVDAGASDARLQDVLSAALAGVPGTAASGMAAPRIVLLSGARGIDAMRRTFEKPMSILAGVAGVVFLIACVNVAGLVLARSLARQREFWIRLALGAGRARLVRQAFIESALLAAAGGVAGLGLCVWAAPMLVRVLAGPSTTAIDVSLDPGLALTALAVSAAAAVLFGSVPALRLANVAAAPEFLRQSGAAAQGPRLRAGSALIAVQIAVSVPLVVGAALFLRTIHNLSAVDLGFEPKNLVMFRLDPALNGYDEERSRQLFTSVLARLDAEPGVRGTTLIENALVSGRTSNTTMTIVGGDQKQILVNRVGPGFFDTLALPIAAGRGIGRQDRMGAPRVAVVNDAAVRQLFGGENPIGRHVRMGGFLKPDAMEIVGVARDSKYSTLKGPARPTIFIPYLQSAGMRGMVVAVRADGARALVGRIRPILAEVTRDIPVTDLKTQEAQINESIGSERLFTILLVFFGAFALLLACIGLHGVTSYAVARRTSEIGVRMALGAQRSQVVWLVLRQVVILAVAGLAAGIPAAAAGSRSVRALLFGVEPADPWSLAAGALALFAVALGAGFAPARRASRLDPLVALRRE